MSLFDAISQFRSVNESNMPVPAPKGEIPNGKQIASKAGFDVGNPKNQKTYTGDAASIPADAEAKAAATKSTAGVKGPGYDASAREKVDVRSEEIAAQIAQIVAEHNIDEAQTRIVPMGGKFHAIHKKTGKSLGEVSPPKARTKKADRQAAAAAKEHHPQEGGWAMDDENMADAIIADDIDLSDSIGVCYENAETGPEFTQLVEKYIGFAKLKAKIAAKGGDADAGAVAAKIGMKKYGKKKFEKAAHEGHKMKGEKHKKPAFEDAYALDNFDGTPKTDQDDLSFADSMMNDKVGRMDQFDALQQESNMPAPSPDNKGPDGKPQHPSKSSFEQKYKGPAKDYKGDGVSIPADAEAKAAATKSTAGVHGVGYDASAREIVDIRNEQKAPTGKLMSEQTNDDREAAFYKMLGV